MSTTLCLAFAFFSYHSSLVCYCKHKMIKSSDCFFFLRSQRNYIKKEVVQNKMRTRCPLTLYELHCSSKNRITAWYSWFFLFQIEIKVKELAFKFIIEAKCCSLLLLADVASACMLYSKKIASQFLLCSASSDCYFDWCLSQFIICFSFSTNHRSS